MAEIDLKKEMKSVGLGMLYQAILVSIGFLLHLKPIGFIILLCLGSAALYCITAFRLKKFRIKPLIISWINIIAVVLGISYLYSLGGFMATVGGSIVYALFFIYQRRKQWFKIKYYLEEKLFGEPLYKFRERGEKPPKLF